MQPARFRQADFLLVEINNAISTSPAVSSGGGGGGSAGSFPEQRLVIEPTSLLEQMVSAGPIPSCRNGPLIGLSSLRCFSLQLVVMRLMGGAGLLLLG